MRFDREVCQGAIEVVEVLAAAIAAIFSASWSYDGYILLRDEVYPAAWVDNIPVSLAVYLTAGVYWNLQWTRARGVQFAFSEPDWPKAPEDAKFRPLLAISMLFMVPVAACFIYFVVANNVTLAP